MAQIHDILLRWTPSTYLGAGGFNAMLLDGATTAPNEGLWVPVEFAKQASVEVFGTSISGMSLQLYGTNIVDPLNGQTLTIGGTVAAAHTITVTVFNPNLNRGQEVVTYGPTSGGDTATTVAAGIAAAINNDLNLAALGIRATSLVAVVSVTYPSVSASSAVASTSSIGFGNWTSFTGTSNGAETVTVANLVNGQTIGAAVTTQSLITIGMNVRNIKARLNSLAAGTVNAQIQGVF